MPSMYDDLWTAAKGVYKTEPAVADGGEVIIYAPHVREVSYVHGRLIDEIGYHCRDYFLAQWERFASYPGGILAHSTHVKGLGTYDAAPRPSSRRESRVTLATGIPRERCNRINLGYRDPAAIDFGRVVPGQRGRIAPSSRAPARCCFASGSLPVASEAAMTYNMGVVGLGVMGANLARNIESKGFPVVGYDLERGKDDGLRRRTDENAKVGSVDSPAALMAALERPRRMLMMVPAGKPVDSVIAHLRPHLEPGDILIDGGNSFFADTDRRCDELAAAGFHFVGAGVSGGEEGALLGPAIMPGGSHETRGMRSRRSSAPSPRRPTTASRASGTWGRAAPATT